MHNSGKSFEIRETPSSIVRIAYHQLSIMSGFEDPTKAKLNSQKELVPKAQDRMICTKRLFRLPIFVSVTSSVCQVYTAIKKSHDSVTSVFDSMENRLSEGMEYISPITGRVGDALETPLKVVDDAVCVGLDFLERRVPSVKLPPYEMYENVTNYFSFTFRQAVERCSNLYDNLLTQIKRLSITSQELLEKESKNESNLENTK